MIETKADALEKNVEIIHPARINEMNEKIDNLNNILK